MCVKWIVAQGGKTQDPVDGFEVCAPIWRKSDKLQRGEAQWNCNDHRRHQLIVNFRRT